MLPARDARPSSFLCDGCDTHISRCARFTCTSCVDFDVCENCYFRSPAVRQAHARSHVFLMIPWSLNDRVTLEEHGSRLHPSLLSLLAGKDDEAVPPSPKYATEGLFSKNNVIIFNDAGLHHILLPFF